MDAEGALGRPKEAAELDDVRSAWLAQQVSRLEILLAREQEVVGGLRRYDQMRVDAVTATYRVWRARLETFAGGLRHLGGAIPDDPDTRETFALLESESGRLIDMLDVLLQAGRPDDRRFASEMTAFLFSELAREVTNPLPERLTILRIEEDAEVLTSDREKVGQVLSLLLDNAVRFSPPDADIVIGAERSDDEFRFWVTDGGPGVPDEVRERIFEPFVRADSSSEGLTDGLGLGLFVARSLVEGLGGKIALDAHPGRGTTFTVSLPQRRTGDMEVATAALEQRAASSA
ncbi:MAG TPA: sensor histidine kinase [Actinomycetota bacterium]